MNTHRDKKTIAFSLMVSGFSGVWQSAQGHTSAEAQPPKLETRGLETADLDASRADLFNRVIAASLRIRPSPESSPEALPSNGQAVPLPGANSMPETQENSIFGSYQPHTTPV